MRRILATAAAFAAMLVLTATAALAAGGTGKMEVSGPSEATVGKEFTVDFQVTENPGIVGIVGVVSYDHDKLELVAVTDTKLFPGSTFSPNILKADTPRLFYLNELLTEDLTTTGVFTQLTFKAKDMLGAAEISVEPMEGGAVNAGNELVPFEGNTISINILASDGASKDDKDDPNTDKKDEGDNTTPGGSGNNGSATSGKSDTSGTSNASGSSDSSKASASKSATPKTGDETPVALYAGIALAIACVAAGAIVFAMKKRKAQ